jgi:hypothetical protein
MTAVKKVNRNTLSFNIYITTKIKNKNMNLHQLYYPAFLSSQGKGLLVKSTFQVQKSHLNNRFKAVYLSILFIFLLTIFSFSAFSRIKSSDSPHFKTNSWEVKVLPGQGDDGGLGIRGRRYILPDFSTYLTTTSIDASAKIRKVFHQNFPEVTNSKITNPGNFYLVTFAEKNSSCRIYYDLDGNFVESIRNYTAEGLSPFLRLRINLKYKGKKIFAVTDVENENEHYYQLILEDAKVLWIVQANDNGSLVLQKKYKKTV